MTYTYVRTDGQDFLHLPYERTATPCMITICDRAGRTHTVHTRLAHTKIDHWMSYPLNDFSGDITIQTDATGWLGAAYVSDEPNRQKRRELVRPRIHLLPSTGRICAISGAQYRDGQWVISACADPLNLEEDLNCTPCTWTSRDLLHWSCSPSARPSSGAKTSNCWIGDVTASFSVSDNKRTYALALGCGRMGDLAAASILSLPADVTDGKALPAAQLSNLRVWVREWQCVQLDRIFHFPMRFRVAPGQWPEIRLLPGENTLDDIQTEACEVELELFVGQEPEITFDLCGVCWRWLALDHTMHCGTDAFPIHPVDGRIHLHFFSDLSVQELFPHTDVAFLRLLQNGPQQKEYKIQSDLVENINNDSFRVQYIADPYLTITSPGATASLIHLKIYGLRPTQYSEQNRALLKHVEKGPLLYQCAPYRVYANCVEDDVYGDPPAWALHSGRVVLSPVRAVEEFRWRDTPWGDMTRLVNRTERWDTPIDCRYPKVETAYPVLNAAWALAADIMEKNRDERYALPGQKGLMNAALFQGPGEGFGSWVRDTCHAAFRCQNLLAPGESRKSLVYIAQRGFNNGVDCAAMPAIAIWDYYVATGDVQILYETLPGLLQYAQEADRRWNAENGLVHANMCLAQDAFEEPENGGYCLGTEILFSLMYTAIANICQVTGQNAEASREWAARGANMRDAIRDLYWNEEAGCFTSGPKGSPAYEDGLWEMTGAEMALWPRFGIATAEQRRRFLSVIQKNPEALGDFGVNWYPFRKEKNHFWRACWVSWTLGLSAAAGDVGDAELIRTLIFQQVRNVLMNKTFHEVLDHDTGRAWRWPGLPWHAAGFMGYIVNGVFGLRYDTHGLHLHPCVPREFDGAILSTLRYRDADYVLEMHGSGTECTVYLDGQPLTGPFGQALTGQHKVDIYAK